MATWHTLETARDLWEDAPEEDDDLEELLDIAQDAVTTYGRPLADPNAIPPGWRRAQLEHARNVYRSMLASQDGSDDLDGFGTPVRYRNLDAAIRELIRPRTVFGGPVG